MSKLIYPKNGIYKQCRDEIKTCGSNLSRAVSACSFNIPSDFNYRAYLKNLDNTLRNYYKEINSIDSNLEKSDSRYEVLENDLITENKKIANNVVIKERDRMII